MANADQEAMLRRDVAEWNEWRRVNPNVEVDLYDANLSGANLTSSPERGVSRMKPCGGRQRCGC